MRENKKKFSNSTYKVVANIIIKDFGPPPNFKAEAHGPAQKIQVGEAVRVFLPHIYVRGKKMPRITFDIYVSKQADVGTMNDFMFLVQSNMDNYLRFWEARQAEAQRGILLP